MASADFIVARLRKGRSREYARFPSMGGTHDSPKLSLCLYSVDMISIIMLGGIRWYLAKDQLSPARHHGFQLGVPRSAQSKLSSGFLVSSSSCKFWWVSAVVPRG